ncbi:hypothetical protein EJ03DRAFT_170598 [Teratosphaeria nubilosa]|uniref:RING-type domain-containing protein n=1 Tax=Teratosphaeria nubilosa TaxID=161662 RepID=A0A6G1LIV6_9PEZI|nr:hypothetical protein EJ03DRAFT_170598 [Teratosphaeria nubilosa]
MRTQDCTTRNRTLAIAAFPKHLQGSRCTHDRDTCRRCWHQWLQTQVSTQRFDQISCVTCSNLLGQGEIRALATEAVYQKYLDAEFKATLSSDLKFVWCPAAGYKSGQIHEDGNIFRCVQCGLKSCSDCAVLFHEDESCDEYQARVNVRPQQELDSAKTLKEIAKICPGPNCGRKLEKISGCDHMTCRLCGHEFCWLCLAAYRDIRRVGNAAHKRDCKYHSDNLS